MRFVIFGAGAIGGVVGARLNQAGEDVVLIARGRHYDAIAADGLTLETPAERTTLRIPVVDTPREISFEPSDVVLLAMKGQDTEPALEALLVTAPSSTPVVCLQNGVENERLALRRFPNVYGALVMSPTAHLEPGVVQAYGARVPGAIDVGRYPSGVDDRCGEIAEAFRAAGFESDSREDVMRYKFAKLIANLANAVQVVCGTEADAGELVNRLRDEAGTVLRAAGIEYIAGDVADMAGRWKRWDVREIGGTPRAGGSSWQSVTRRTGRVESDYLNGEIVLRGRLLGVPAPVNQLIQELARETVRDGHDPGWLSPAEVLARLQ